jgi:O-acetyl-ADP-ribose deacetylase (regulator of RNase III)
VIFVVAGDLASQAADAVVRPATTTLDLMDPALRSLDAAAGPRFEEQHRLRHELAPGAAVVTAGGDLSTEFVIHAVLGTAADAITPDLVRRAVEAALWQCTQWQIATLACPALGAPALSAVESANVILPVIREHLRNAGHPTTVLIVLNDPDDEQTFTARLGQGDL